VTILIFCFRNIKYGEDRGGKDEERRVHEVTSRADPLTDSKRQIDCWIVPETPVSVEKSFGFEFFRIWVHVWVVQDRPDKSRMNVQTQVEGQSVYHALATTIDPFEPNESVKSPKAGNDKVNELYLSE
jgi:hypothetical protein